MKDAYLNRIAIVTGGASGIGRALCLEMAQRGASVLVADINQDGADRVASSIIESGGMAKACFIDVSDSESVESSIRETVASYGGIDYYFNNAAICVTGDALDISLELWHKVMAVNYFGILNGTLAAYRHMRSQGSGHIVNVSSIGGFAPFSMNAPYIASKYAVAGLTETLRSEAAGSGVNFTLVYPGMVRTEFYDSVCLVNLDRDTYLSRMPSRLITPEKAAGKILYGVAKKKKRIMFPFHARLIWWTNKFFPCLLDIINRKLAREFRSLKD